MDCDMSEVKVDRFNWFIEHPKIEWTNQQMYQEMLAWGFEDTQQLQTTLLVYLDLCEAKNWWNMEVHPCYSLQMAYLTGRPNKRDNYATILPVQAKTVLSPASLSAFLATIEPKHRNQEGSDKGLPHSSNALIPDEHRAKRMLTLAITDSDSTIVYYHISDGLVSPDAGPKKSDDEEDAAAVREEKGRGKGQKAVKRRAAVETVDHCS